MESADLRFLAARVANGDDAAFRGIVDRTRAPMYRLAARLVGNLAEAEDALQEAYVDAYRALHPEGQDYTWWSNRGAARANNVGWRIDYQIVTPSLRPRLQACSIYRDERFSDHAPFTVDYAE